MEPVHKRPSIRSHSTSVIAVGSVLPSAASTRPVPQQLPSLSSPEGPAEHLVADSLPTLTARSNLAPELTLVRPG